MGHCLCCPSMRRCAQCPPPTHTTTTRPMMPRLQIEQIVALRAETGSLGERLRAAEGDKTALEGEIQGLRDQARTPPLPSSPRMPSHMHAARVWRACVCMCILLPLSGCSARPPPLTTTPLPIHFPSTLTPPRPAGGSAPRGRRARDQATRAAGAGDARCAGVAGGARGRGARSPAGGAAGGGARGQAAGGWVAGYRAGGRGRGAVGRARAGLDQRRRSSPTLAATADHTHLPPTRLCCASPRQPTSAWARSRTR